MRYCVLVQLERGSAPARIGSIMGHVKGELDRFTSGDHVMLFASPDGLVSGHFINTDEPAARVQTALERAPEVGSSDSIFVFEIGRECVGRGCGRAGTWLQRQ